MVYTSEHIACQFHTAHKLDHNCSLRSKIHAEITGAHLTLQRSADERAASGAALGAYVIFYAGHPSFIERPDQNGSLE